MIQVPLLVRCGEPVELFSPLTTDIPIQMPLLVSSPTTFDIPSQIPLYWDQITFPPIITQSIQLVPNE